MDREVHVTNEGLLFAELKFYYDTQVSGKVEVTYYNSHWVVPPSIYPPNPGIQVSVPSLIHRQPVKHDVIPSMDVLKKFDSMFLNEIPPRCPKPGHNAVLEYINYHRRYPIDKPMHGLIDTQADFAEGVKLIKFISADNWRRDKDHLASCLKTDAVLIAHMDGLWQAEQKK